MNLILILTFILVNQSICSYIASDSTSQCVSIENSSAYKWCRYSTYYAMGYYCSTSDQATPFGDDPNYKCSSDTSSLPQNSKYLLCPVSTSDCNTQTLNLSTDTSSITASSNSFSIGTVCWYKFTPDVSSIKSIKVDLMSLQNANAEVYVETSTNEYNYKGTIGSGYSVNATIDAHDSVWVLITPLASNAYASIITYASPYSNEESSSSLSTSTIIVIVASSIGCCCCCIIVICLTIGCSLIKLRKCEKRGKPECECKDIEIPVPMINNYQIQNRPQSNNHSTKSQSSSVEYEIPVNLKMEQNGINNYPKLVLFANDSVPSNSIQTDKEKKVSDSKA